MSKNIKTCKKLFTATLIMLTLIVFSMFAIHGSAASNTSGNKNVSVNDKLISFYTYDINGKTYYNIRDIAFKISGTQGQFDIVTDKKTGITNIITNRAYKKTGGEMSKPGSKMTPKPNTNKLQKNGIDLRLTSYTVNNNVYLEISDICKLLDFTLSFDNKMKISILDSVHKPNVLSPKFEVGMRYGRMVYDEKVKNYVCIDDYGNLVKGWAQTEEGVIRLFYPVHTADAADTPVIFCGKDIISDGRYYFLDAQLLYRKTINGINIPLDADGGISARDLQKVLGAYYADYIHATPVHLFNIGYPAPRNLPADKTKYKLSLDAVKINLSNYQKYQLSPVLSPAAQTIKKYTYKSSDKSIAFVDEDGTIYAISNGYCTIEASLKDRPDVTAKIEVSVTGCKNITNKLSTGYVLLDYLDDDVGNRYLSPTVDAAKNDGVNWVNYVDTYSYYQADPVIMGPVLPQTPDSTAHSLRDSEFRTLVEEAHKQKLKISMQAQICYDQIVSTIIDSKELSNTNTSDFYNQMAGVYGKFGQLFSDKALEYNKNPQGKEINEYWDGWFSQYEKIMLSYAVKCQKYGVDMLIIGEGQGNRWYRVKEDRWHKLMSDIRKVYSGPIAVNCNIYEMGSEFDDIKFLDDVDYIYAVLFEPNSSYPDPTVSQFKDESDKRLKVLDDIYEKTGKKMFLTVQIRSTENGGNIQWFDVGMTAPQYKSDFAIQVRMFEGMFEALESRKWLESVWANCYNYLDQFDVPNGDLNSVELGQSVRNKPASQIFKIWSK